MPSALRQAQCKHLKMVEITEKNIEPRRISRRKVLGGLALVLAAPALLPRGGMEAGNVGSRKLWAGKLR